MKQFEAVRAKQAIEATRRVLNRSVQGHVEVGQAMATGDITVEPIGAGLVMVSIGRDLAFAINVHPSGGAGVTAFYDTLSTRTRPQIIDATKPAQAPLCRFGPGGDFVQDYNGSEDAVPSPVAKCQVPVATDTEQA